MSQLLQVATRDGGHIPIVEGVAPPTYVDQGIPYMFGGLVAVTNLGVIDHYWQGLPFTAAGRLATVLNSGQATRIAPGGAPFDAAGLLAFGTGLVDHYSAGIPYTALQQLKTL